MTLETQKIDKSLTEMDTIKQCKSPQGWHFIRQENIATLETQNFY